MSEVWKQPHTERARYRLIGVLERDLEEFLLGPWGQKILDHEEEALEEFASRLRRISELKSRLEGSGKLWE